MWNTLVTFVQLQASGQGSYAPCCPHSTSSTNRKLTTNQTRQIEQMEFDQIRINVSNNPLSAFLLHLIFFSFWSVHKLYYNYLLTVSIQGSGAGTNA